MTAVDDDYGYWHWEDDGSLRWSDDDDYCIAPGRNTLGLCSDDMCRGAGVCMYVAAES